MVSNTVNLKEKMRNHAFGMPHNEKSIETFLFRPVQNFLRPPFFKLTANQNKRDCTSGCQRPRFRNQSFSTSNIYFLFPFSVFLHEDFVIEPCGSCRQSFMMMSSLVSQDYDAELGSHHSAPGTSYPSSGLPTSATHRRFSPARRLFCLLALFDFLATLFIWILYAHVSNPFFFCFFFFVKGMLANRSQ